MVINLRGKGADIAMSGTATGGTMPDGALLPDTGYTSDIGADLTNDHPISFTYDATLSSNDGELRTPPLIYGSTTVVGNRASNVKPTYPLENSQMQCATCHDPHFWDSDPTDPPLKFLRGMRLQLAQPLGGVYVASSDIMCLACHDNDKGVGMWSNSAHANINVATETFTNFATLEFPSTTTVWQASCLGCHDTHTVPGARHLLREGTDSPTVPKSGGNSAMEETCYQCHSAQGTTVLEQSTPTPNMVPDIKSDFALAIHMPISTQPEVHNIGGSFNDSSTGGTTGGIATGTTGQCNVPGDQCDKDLMESEALLGKPTAGGFDSNRHTECTDCHNPHRTTKNRLFNSNAAIPDVAGTHLHNIDLTNPAAHSNIASGSLRGGFGVEPVYGSNDFGTPGIPTTFTVKRGDPGLSVLSDVGEAYVTREYQVCLKCHSNYAYDTPDLLGYVGGTPTYTNGFNTYMNTAMEIQAPATHMGAPVSTSDSGAYAPTYSAYNYRSWHPVMNNTGRTVGIGNPRGNASPNLWRSPWNGSDTDGPLAVLRVTSGAVGNQTMYCSDCHGSGNAIANGVVPDGNGSTGAWTEDGNPWGPHGSAENFLLKGPSATTSPVGVATDTLCFRCHDATQYADATGAPSAVLQSGFSTTGNDVLNTPMTNLHQRHAYYTSSVGITALGTNTVWSPLAANTYRCTMCHTGTAHGWKNKAFLVNLNDIGPEVNKAINGTVGGALGGETALPIPPGTVLTAGQNVPSGTQVPSTLAPVPTGYTNGPYYQGALLYIASTGFKASGAWTKGDCATSGCHY
ncbi:MAG: cytochrome c3 family protein [Gallionella sp.]